MADNPNSIMEMDVWCYCCLWSETTAISQSPVTTQALHLAFNNAENAIGSDQDFPFFD
jgi:hypothetical protein